MILVWLRRRLACRRISLRYWCYRRPLVTFSLLALLIVGLQLVLMVVLSSDREQLGSGSSRLEQQRAGGPRHRVEKVVQRHHRLRQASQSRGKILGVPSHLLEKYLPDQEGFFLCLHSNQTVDFSKLNDDYCDCVDGTDEPSTSGCSGANGLFYCNDVTAIPSSRVNDGICDCCEGIDEFRGRILIRGLDQNRQAQLGLHLPPCQNFC